MLEKVFIFQLEQAFLDKPNNQMTLPQFVMAFLDHVKHDKDEEVYISAGLIDMYNDILQMFDAKLLKWEHFTSFIIENVVESDMEDYLIPSKFISKMTSSRFKNIYNSSELTKYTPIVIGGSDLCLRRFSISTKIMDSIHHDQGIKKIQHFPEDKLIGCLDNITEYIKIYDEKGSLVRQLGSKKEDPNIDNAILHFAYSNHEK
jgi:hypothetical protein